MACQVMDPGVGITFNETVRYQNEDDGKIYLATSPLTMYDTYFESYYNNEWHIRVDYSRVITVNVTFVAFGVNDTVEVFDGPWRKNLLLMYLSKKSSRGSDEVTSSGFQVIFSGYLQVFYFTLAHFFHW